MLVAITRLRLNSLWDVAGFMKRNRQIERQLAKTAGYRNGRVLICRQLVFWTASSWDDERSMRKFMASNAHLAAMPWLAGHCREAATAHFTAADGVIPAWSDLHAELLATPRFVKCDRPTPAHTAQQLPNMDRMILGKDLIRGM